jgi:prevent-host-death family protein
VGVVTVPTAACDVRRTDATVPDMTSVASRELRNNTRALLDRVEAGESIIITVDGRQVAELRPLDRAPQWMTRDEFIRRVLPRQADPGLLAALRELNPDTTDDLPNW